MSTRPVDPKKQVISAPTRPVARKSATGSVDEVAATKAVQATSVSVDLSITSHARAEAKNFDTARLQSLKESVAAGTYEPDAREIAQRMADEVLGPELDE